MTARQAASAANKIPNFQGLVYRGIHIAPEDMTGFLDRYTPGNTVVEPAFTSSDLHAANPGNVEFVIESTSGKDISWLKDPSVGQHETIHPPGQGFEVLDRQFNDATNRWRIYLRDIGR